MTQTQATEEADRLPKEVSDGQKPLGAKFGRPQRKYLQLRKFQENKSPIYKRLFETNKKKDQ